MTRADARIWAAVALIALTAAMPSAGNADAAELSQAEMRSAMRSGALMDSRALIEGLEELTGGAVIEIRAFASGDSEMTFRVVVRMESGKVSLMLVDGVTGEEIPNDSPGAEDVRAAARAMTAARVRTFAAARPGRDTETGSTAASASASSTGATTSAAASSSNNGNGNGRAVGRTNGNGNGNGNSNAGGNGRGNANGLTDELESD